MKTKIILTLLILAVVFVVGCSPLINQELTKQTIAECKGIALFGKQHEQSWNELILFDAEEASRYAYGNVGTNDKCLSYNDIIKVNEVVCIDCTENKTLELNKTNFRRQSEYDAFNYNDIIALNGFDEPIRIRFNLDVNLTGCEDLLTQDICSVKQKTNLTFVMAINNLTPEFFIFGNPNAWEIELGYDDVLRVEGCEQVRCACADNQPMCLAYCFTCDGLGDVARVIGQ